MISEKAVPWATPEDVADFGKRVTETYRLTTNKDLMTCIRLLASLQRVMAGVQAPTELAKVLFIDPTTRLDQVMRECEVCGVPSHGRFCARHRHG